MHDGAWNLASLIALISESPLEDFHIFSPAVFNLELLPAEQTAS